MGPTRQLSKQLWVAIFSVRAVEVVSAQLEQPVEWMPSKGWKRSCGTAVVSEASRLEADLIEQHGRTFPTLAPAAEVAHHRQAKCVRPTRHHHRQLAFQR